MKQKWIDTHIHVSEIGEDGKRRERLLDDLIDVLDRCDADLRFVISPDIDWVRIVKEDEGGAAGASEFIHNLVRCAPGRLYGSCLVNPHFLDASLKVMEMCFERWGFVQLGEMLQYIMDYEMNSDSVERLVRQAMGYDVPVQVHISTSDRGEYPSSFGMKQLRDMFGIVERVPEAKYILAHAVGMPDDNPPVVDRYLDAVEEKYEQWPENFWVEIRDFNSPGVGSVIARVPSTRIIAGTDWTTRVGPPFLPYGTIFGVKSREENAYPPCVASMIAFLKEAGCTDEMVSQIGFENAAALFHIKG